MAREEVINEINKNIERYGRTMLGKGGAQFMARLSEQTHKTEEAKYYKEKSKEFEEHGNNILDIIHKEREFLDL